MYKVWKTSSIDNRYEVSNYGEVRNIKTQRKLTPYGASRYSKYVYIGNKARNIEYVISLEFNLHERHQDSAVNVNNESKLAKNLTPCTRSERTSVNMKKVWAKRNARKGRTLVGAYKNLIKGSKKPYRAMIKHLNKLTTIGYYNTKKEAHLAFKAKHLELFGFEHGSI